MKGPNLNLPELKELLELLNERNITEFELEEDGVKLRIKKGVVEAVASSRVDQQVINTNVGSSPSDTSTASLPDTTGLMIVKAPMVGTFYRQPGPGEAPFAEKGAQVNKGQVLCIIEAMKLMNDILSEYQGELVEAYVDDGQPVSFGDPLFAIRET